jgi:TPR repeat protein
MVRPVSALGWTLMDDEKTKAEAEKWLSRAEEHGSEHARYHLALLLRDTDRERSKRLFQKCAKQGDRRDASSDCLCH